MKCALLVTTFLASMLSACTVFPNTGDVGVVTQPTPYPAPVIINVHTDNKSYEDKADKKNKQQVEADKVIHVCTLSAFTSQYQSENTNRGRARLDIKKQCLAKFHEMFCRDQDIKCTEYS